MKKWIVLLTVIFLVTATVSAIAEKPKPYKVGGIFAITGSASWLGEPERNTAEMIAEEINKNGGINGHELKLYIEDTQGDNTRAVNAVKKLIKMHKVCAIIGPSRSGTSLAVIPVMQESQVPLISCAAAEQIVVPVEERKWIFKSPQKDSDAVRRIYEDMNKKGISRIGIITGTTGFGNGGRAQLGFLAPDYNIKILTDETYSPSDTDMTAQLLNIKKTDPQAIVNWSIVPAQSIVAKNMKQLKMDLPLYQSHGFGNVKYAEAAGEAGNGIIFPAGRLLAVDSLDKNHPQYKVLNDYKTKYEEKFKDNVSTFGGHAYDALWLVANALKAVGDDPAKVRDYIENTKGFVGTGGVFNYSPQDHNGLTKEAFEMLTVKDQKFVVLGE
jgi:branched-chain amino acid transport system substrate-binding protein